MSYAYHGKKVGVLEVKLDRRKNSHTHVTLDVELRFDIGTGTFWAQYGGDWFSADTKAALTAQLKVAATKAISIEWKRYIQIDYEAKGWPIADEKTGRPERQGRYCSYSIGEDRSKFEDNKDEKYAICGVELHWDICEISEPYALPENPKKIVRAKREVTIHTWGKNAGKEQISEAEEWDHDVMPPGALLWTPEREALLVEILAALGKLDQRLIHLFSGDAKQLAAKIDAAQTDPSRLLPAPQSSSKRKASR